MNASRSGCGALTMRVFRDHRLRASLQRGVAGDLQMPDHLDIPIPGLGGRVGLAGQNGAGDGLGIDRVALAVLAPEPTVRAIDLNDAVPLGYERPAQACAVGAGALDAEGPDGPASDGPANELPVPRRCCGDREGAEMRTEPGDRDGDVNVLVGVDADDDRIGWGGMHVGPPGSGKPEAAL